MDTREGRGGAQGGRGDKEKTIDNYYIIIKDLRFGAPAGAGRGGAQGGRGDIATTIIITL